MADIESGGDQLDHRSFDRMVALVRSSTGINLSQSKKTMLEGRLRRRAAALGLKSLRDYCKAVFEDDKFKGEVINLIDAVTTNKTDFFREPAHFKFLSETALPELAKRDRPTKFWSAACSNGAEPYTLAMVLSDFALTAPGWRFSILASDISTDVLAKARRGVFPEEMVDPVPLPMRQRYLLRHNEPSIRLVRMAPEIRRLVHFARINLIEERYGADSDMDVIFCRNLLIYFDRTTQEAVIRRLCSYLRVGGCLILGHTDSISGMSLPLEWVGNSILRRT